MRKALNILTVLKAEKILFDPERIIISIKEDTTTNPSNTFNLS